MYRVESRSIHNFLQLVSSYIYGLPSLFFFFLQYMREPPDFHIAVVNFFNSSNWAHVENRQLEEPHRQRNLR